MGMISNNFKKLKKQLDLPLMLKYSIVLGGFCVVLGYPMNSRLTSILAANLGLLTATPNQVSYQSENNIETDNVVASILGISTKSCKMLTGTVLTSENDMLTLLNQHQGLKRIGGYNDIVYLRAYGINTNEFTRLRKEPAENLRRMLQVINQNKISTFVSSGYRTLDDQTKNMQTWTAIVGSQNAGQYAAKPGFSEHHLGTTVDILSYENNLNLEPSYSKTKLYKWLKNNAHKYGFVESYPKDMTATTGYTYEPWHYRYVGVELATNLQNNNELLQDYLYKLYGYCLVE